MLDGRFKLNATTPVGNQSGFMTMKTEDGALTGTMEMLGSTFGIENGTCDGDKANFETTVKAYGMTFKFKCDVEVAGDDLTLSMTSPMARVSAKGTRV